MAEGYTSNAFQAVRKALLKSNDADRAFLRRWILRWVDDYVHIRHDAERVPEKGCSSYRQSEANSRRFSKGSLVPIAAKLAGLTAVASGHGYGMCNAGALWRSKSEDARAVLKERQVFLKHVRQHVGWEVDDAAAAAIFGELVANVVQHSPGPIRASLNCEGDQLALHVEDDGDLFALEPHLPRNVLSEGGRGLFIAARYASALRVESRPCGGKAVIAVLPEKRRLYLF